MKLHKSIVLFGASALLLTACGEESSSTDDLVEDQEDTEVVTDVEDVENIEEVEEVDATETEESDSNVGKRSNPVSLGEKVQMTVNIYESIDSFDSEEGILEVAITNIIDGDEAFDFIMNENQFNDEAPEGYQWIILDVEATLVEGSEDNPYTPIPYITTVSDSGEETPDLGVYASIENEFGWNDLFNGGSTSGKIAVLAPTAEDYLIKWDEGFINSIFFDNK